ncbi:MAG: methionine biosynthesis protein MetW [Clostridiaceae bacterium]
MNKNDNGLILINTTQVEGAGISKITIKDEFNKKINRLTRSSAYLDFCEEVYGYRLYLFNMLDKQQIDFILSSIQVSSEDTIVDLGCGSGSILNQLMTKYGCQGIGIDQLDEDILGRTSKSITYIKGDMERISDYNLKQTITLSVDSLYFCHDLGKLVQQLNSIENNRMYLFYSEYIFDEVSGDRSILHSHNTKLGAALSKNGIPFKTIDYSENERLLYENSLRVLKNYKRVFESEDNKDLYEQKLKEDLMGRELYSKGLAIRYLYIIEGI